jgi:hypothetical protein
MPPIKVSHFDAHAPATACSDYLLERTVIDALPERRGSRHAFGRLVARDDAGIDRADRCAGGPVGFNASFMQCLINGNLIGSQRITALQPERNLT